MTWDEFNDKVVADGEPDQRFIKTGIACPKCGRQVYYDIQIYLTTMPAQFFYLCKCGWTGYSHKKWRNEDETADEV